MNYLIAGLGNIGTDYEHTRHNIGFDVVSFLAAQHQAVFSSSRLAAKTQIRIKGRTLHLIQPSTYMNLSGRAVKYWLQMTNTDLSNFLVITDDVSLPFGKLRIRKQGSNGGHNGLKSLDEHLNTNEYARLRIGIGNDYPKGRQSDYVLGKWTEQEKEELPKYIETASEAIVCFVLEGLDRAMNKFNVKK
ncbi:MAG: aminoacyl-tRNA hydrolase [Sphingobacteriales bacterium]|nr:MAG: aminoacyl-tRNA hydrolase [Sphingobacteriales bacterium]